MFRSSVRCLCNVARSTKTINSRPSIVVPAQQQQSQIQAQSERFYSSAINQQCSRLRIHRLLYVSEVSRNRKRTLSSERRKKIVPQQLTFQNVKELLKTEQEAVVIDVREPDELKSDGKITNMAKNIPLPQIANSLNLSDEEFSQTYGFNKPKYDDTIVFHCKMGVRASQAAHAYADAGYTKIKMYPGIVDWTENGGKLEQ